MELYYFSLVGFAFGFACGFATCILLLRYFLPQYYNFERRSNDDCPA